MEYEDSGYVTIPQGQIMREAREDLSGYWSMGVGLMLITLIITAAAGLVPFIPFLISGPIALGVVIWAQNVARDRSPRIENVFDGFQNFVSAIIIYILTLLAVIVGMMFFIIPGIIIGMGLSQTMYILADDPEIGAFDAMRESWDMMDGYKWDLFVLNIRFLPWMLLSILTLFIGMLWLVPWMQVANARFHDYLIQYDEYQDQDVTDHLIDD